MKSRSWLGIIDGAVRVTIGAVSVFVALMALQLIVESAGRNLLSAPLPGTNDVITYVWMPGIAILALGYAQLRDEHIRVTILTEKTSPQARRVLEIATEAIGGLTALALAVLSTQVFLQALKIGKRAISTSWLPLWPGQLLVAVGFAVCFLAAAARIYRLAVGEQTDGADDEKLEGSIID